MSETFQAEQWMRSLLKALDEKGQKFNYLQIQLQMMAKVEENGGHANTEGLRGAYKVLQEHMEAKYELQSLE